MYPYSYPSTHSISGLAAGGVWEQFEVHLKIKIKWTQRYTLRPWSSKIGDTLVRGYRAYLELHLDTVIKWTAWCTPRSWSRKFGDAPGGHECVDFQPVIERPWRCTWRQLSSECGGWNRARLDEYFEAVDARCTRCWDSVHLSVN